MKTSSKVYRKHLVFSIVCILASIYFIAASILSAQAPTRGWLTVELIMRDPAWMGVSPRNPYWSEDGRHIYFYWRREGDTGDSLYTVDARGGTPRRVGMHEEMNLPQAAGEYDRERRRKVYVRDGDLFLYDLRKKTEIRLSNTVNRKTHPLFNFNGMKISYVSNRNLYLHHLETGMIEQLTNIISGNAPEEKKSGPLRDYMAEQQLELFEFLRLRKHDRDVRQEIRETYGYKRPRAFYSGEAHPTGFRISPDERFITFLIERHLSSARNTIVPDYVTESGYTETIPGREKAGDENLTTEFYLIDRDRDTVYLVDTGGLPGTASDEVPDAEQRESVLIDGPYWSDDGKNAFVHIISRDNKNRWIVRFEPESGALTTVLDHQFDEAWIGGPGIARRRSGTSLGWMPDSRRVYFQSEVSGYSHLYVVNFDGSGKRPLTEGNFETYDARISNDGSKWYITTNEEHFGERHLYEMPIEGGARRRLTMLAGRNDAVISPDEKRICMIRSFKNEPPELYVADNKPGATPVRITDSQSAEFSAYDWRAPGIVFIPASDGMRVPARLYKPESPNGAAVIFVHGAGYLQNAHRWWSTYYREYMFHNMLADMGYTVLDIDYRGSAGHGRDWRTAVYRYMGGRDLQDHIDGARYLVEEHGIDPDRIGIYGGSYGGFITLMAMFTKPGIFAAGAALRPVTDWAHYAHWYSSNILNLPFEDDEAYRRSSPIYHAGGLEGALLITAPMVDTNVHFQDAVRLVQRLIELGKDNWDIALYPAEDHAFVEPASWTDQFRRILKLFETNLR